MLSASSRLEVCSHVTIPRTETGAIDRVEDTRIGRRRRTKSRTKRRKSGHMWMTAEGDRPERHLEGRRRGRQREVQEAQFPPHRSSHWRARSSRIGLEASRLPNSANCAPVISSCAISW